MSMATFSTDKLQNPWWIHTPQDGRGKRTVFLNGTPLQDVLYADEMFGEAECFVRPFCIVNGELQARKLVGKIRVVFDRP